MNWFLLAVKNSFDFKGRARRREFGWYNLVILVVFIAITFLEEAATKLSLPLLGQIFFFIDIILGSILTFIGISLTTRRLHDMNCSGWWQLLMLPIYLYDMFGYFYSETEIEHFIQSSGTLTPLSLLLSGAFSLVLALFCLFKDGQKHPNKYGESPKYPSANTDMVVS